MSDPNEKGSESCASAGSSDEGQSTDLKKTCVDCGTSKTPLWRGGPAGPKSLCNACGIRSRKKRRPSDEMKKPKKSNNGGGLKLNLHQNSAKTKLTSDPWKRKLMVGLRSEVSTKRRTKMGEVEQAAALLMALSYGSVSA